MRTSARWRCGFRDLRALQQQLKTLRERCSAARDVADCGILNELAVNNACGGRPTPQARQRARPRTASTRRG